MHQNDWPVQRVWEVCATYARFGKPLHFTETTVLSGKHGWQLPAPWPSTAEGEARQAEYVEKFYTVLFSHPAVQAITWWDFMDGMDGRPGRPGKSGPDPQAGLRAADEAHQRQVVDARRLDF